MGEARRKHPYNQRSLVLPGKRWGGGGKAGRIMLSPMSYMRSTEYTSDQGASQTRQLHRPLHFLPAGTAWRASGWASS